MLSEKRVKEAENNVRQYLKEGLLEKRGFEGIVFNVPRNNAKESLNVAEYMAKNSMSDLWIIVISYYSMYYVANAALYKMGYKVKDKIPHKVTVDSLIVFARKKLADSLIESYEGIKDQALAAMKSGELMEKFDFERRKRSIIQYQTKEFEKHAKAKTSLQRAKEFAFEMEKLMA